MGGGSGGGRVHCGLRGGGEIGLLSGSCFSAMLGGQEVFDELYKWLWTSRVDYGVGDWCSPWGGTEGVALSGGGVGYGGVGSGGMGRYGVGGDGGRREEGAPPVGMGGVRVCVEAGGGS